MKTNAIQRTVTTEVGESSQFTISNNAKIFRILIDGLYADKIQSITREIWSNALDAHVQAGCADRPFDVSFPNVFDPTFRVRDYGVSLTHDQVMHMYTDLGNSTKEDTNDAVGKFGIGSKSPFAYTDNFTVTVVKDGEKRYYSAMIGANGVPAIHLMGREDTDEEPGVEVAFPVEKDDVGAFAKAAQRIAHGFDVKPNVVNTDNFKGWEELDVLAEGDGWKLLRGGIAGYQKRAYARMGPVLYPINANALPNLSYADTQLLGHTLIIDFAMGELEITASREELSYGRNDPTAMSISRRVKEVTETMVARVLESYAPCPTYWDACCKYADDIAAQTIPEGVRNIIKTKAEWRGERLSGILNVKSFRNATLSVLSGKELSRRTLKHSIDLYSKIVARDNTILVVGDETEEEIKRAPARLRHFLDKNHNVKQVIWLDVRDTRRNTTELCALFDLLDGIPIYHLADMELPRRSSSSGPRRPVMARVLNTRGYTESIALDAEDFEAGGIYFPMERMEAVVPARCSPPNMILHAMELLGFSETVIGAPKSMSKKFSGPQWRDFYEVAREFCKKFEFDPTADYMLRKAVGTVKQEGCLQFLFKYVARDQLSDRSAVHNAMELYERVQTMILPDFTNIRLLTERLGMLDAINEDADPDDIMVEYDLVMESLGEAYPLLEILSSAHVTDTGILLDKVTSYVIMCDTANESPTYTAIAA